MYSSARVLLVSTVGSFVLVGSAGFGHADTIQGDIFVNTVYQQTSASQPTPSSAQYIMGIGAFFSGAGDFTSGTATDPGAGSPQTLTPLGNTSLNYYTPFYSSLSGLNSAYPFGTYTINVNGPAGSQTSTLHYSANYFETSSIPYISDYSGLNGLNPDTSFTVDFPSYTPNPSTSAGSQFTFFTIYNQSTGAAVVSDEFQSPTTIDDVIAAGTLAPNTTYSYEIDYSNRLNGTDSADGTFTEQGFDVRTDGTFTTGAAVTAVPEPASLSLLGSAIAGFGLIRRRRRRYAGAAQ